MLIRNGNISGDLVLDCQLIERVAAKRLWMIGSNILRSRPQDCLSHVDQITPLLCLVVHCTGPISMKMSKVKLKRLAIFFKKTADFLQGHVNLVKPLLLSQVTAFYIETRDTVLIHILF